MWALVTLLFFPSFSEPAIPIEETKVVIVRIYESKEACHKELHRIVTEPGNAGDTLAVNSIGDLEVTGKSLLSKHVCKKTGIPKK